jgi:hypothetical protein
MEKVWRWRAGLLEGEKIGQPMRIERRIESQMSDFEVVTGGIARGVVKRAVANPPLRSGTIVW